MNNNINYVTDYNSKVSRYNSYDTASSEDFSKIFYYVKDNDT